MDLTLIVIKFFFKWFNFIMLIFHPFISFFHLAIRPVLLLLTAEGAKVAFSTRTAVSCSILRMVWRAIGVFVVNNGIYHKGRKNSR